MNTYLLLKWLHIVSSVVLVGTGFGSAFYLFFANRSGSLAAQAVVAGLVVRADTWFTAPAVLIQPLSGYALARMAGWPLSSFWLSWALVLYLLAGACWLPVLFLQLRMARDAQAALRSGQALAARYAQDARRWERLGYPAFIAMLLVFGLMVFKPM
jgi:uncharacterized membrane protein